MKHVKILFTAVLLSSLLVGGIVYLSSLNSLFRLGDHKQPAVSKNLYFSAEEYKPDRFQALLDPAVQDTSQQRNRTAEQPGTIEHGKRRSLPGLFRGDWGETPVYAKNDRVNSQRGVYLSLEDGNQNQPPETSPSYWRLLKKLKALHEENCLTPAPGMDMGECDFSEAGSLKGLNLQGAKLIKARLNGELGAADLTGANLSGATVIGTLVISPETRLENANLSYLQSDGNNPVVAENADLTGINFTKATLYGAKFSHADLSGAKMPEAVLTGSQLTSARFDKADLSKTDMTYANLAKSSLAHSVMADANLEQADLSQADLSQADLQKANLAGAQIAGANFAGADLRGVNFSSAQGADFSFIDDQTDFTAAICPDGVTVDGTQVTTCIGHGF